MNMATSSAYALRLMQEIEEINLRINDLNNEKAALQRQLQKAYGEANALQDVSRKNSGTRVMVEHKILGALQNSQVPLNNKKLFIEAMRANIHIKPATFRTYLARLQEKGKIQNAGKRGLWKLSE